MSIGVFDYDFFNYENVIPNLECAKLVTYYRQHNHLAVLTPTLVPEPYTRYFIRKEYDDGSYPHKLFLPNCEYGGRAFNPEQYIPLPPEIERTIPDMHIYDKYISSFGKKNTEQTQIKRILNCAHMRLAPDSQNLLPFEEFQPYFNKVSGIFLHDYDLASLKAYDLILQLQNQREFRTKPGVNPYPVGNKFPIKIYSSEELEKWYKVVTIPNAFFLEYYGYMSDEILYKLCLENRRMARQVYYNVTYGCSSENDFLMNRLPKIFVQVLFLRIAGIRILLNYDEDFLKTKELRDLVRLLNCWLRFKWFSGYAPHTQPLYKFCRDNSYFHYTTWEFLTVDLSVEEMRNTFQYVRERNYELFKMFYEWDEVKYRGGKIVNEWT